MAENRDPEFYNMNNLQQDAIRRAREMQARAQIPPSYPTRPVREEDAPPPPEQDAGSAPPGGADPFGKRQPDTGPHPSNGTNQPGGSIPFSGTNPFSGQAIGGALDFLTKDGERSMLLMLLLILIEEKADTSIIFALMYLLI